MNESRRLTVLICLLCLFFIPAFFNQLNTQFGALLKIGIIVFAGNQVLSRFIMLMSIRVVCNYLFPWSRAPMAALEKLSGGGVGGGGDKNRAFSVLPFAICSHAESF